MNWINEYPRPQLRRKSFFSLNGKWLLNGHEINVPFPPQSKLSRYTGNIGDTLDYERTFTLPDGFVPESFQVLLHFGAVDQIAEVSVNGHHVAKHEGGYLPFSCDITNLIGPGENHLKVRAIDTLSLDYPYGKQRKKHGGMWYTPVSGIWQSVWIEAVPPKRIESISITPDLEGIVLSINSPSPCKVIIPEAGDFEYIPGKPMRIDISNPRHWSIQDPFLYTMTIKSGDDCVESYFALRTIETDTINGRSCVLLNGKPLFINGVLDQGYFEKGIYLPETPADYEKDIRNMKSLGVNLLRKHCKIEPEAFYYACDRMGMLVMQDMVNNGSYSFIPDTALPTIGLQWRPDKLRGMIHRKRRTLFTQHALDTQNRLYNHPCVVAYTIFNEGWGQFDADKHYQLLKKADPSRLYDATSGWFAQHESDFYSRHVYFRNMVLRGKKRPLLLSECGGFARPVQGHMFNESNKYGYGTVESEEALTAKIEEMWEKMVFPSISGGLCGLVYTQVSDVEDEINGFYTYDRQICKVNKERIKALAKKGQQLLEQK